MPMARRGFHWLLGALLLVSFVAVLPEHQERVSKPEFKPDYVPGHDRLNGQWQMRFASDGETPLVHAPSMVALPDGRLRAFWFAGKREGGPDVAIHSAIFDPQQGAWSEEERVVTREQIRLQWGRHVRKLGNAVPVLDEDGRMRLFVVAVSFGGWAASRLVVLESDDMGASWRFDEALVTSPFLNISTLVKTPPIRYQDGTVGLPVYHEMVGKFGEILRLDDHNRIVDKERIGHGRKAIQPLVLVDGPKRATAFLRNETDTHPDFLYRSETRDGGGDWSPLRPSQLQNPSSAVGGVVLSPGHWLLVANCNPMERDDLCMRETHDGGKTWSGRYFFHNRAQWREGNVPQTEYMEMISEEVAGTLETESPSLLRQRVERNKCAEQGCEFQYDYPYVIQAANGDVHILYTWNKSAIRHAWLPEDQPLLGGMAGDF
ncbi:exo-alpha-sialidase [Alloalcanivorax sp.]|uniref:sialidase family protein n=1 Tax=Alloalcanivorax sp. TaxID=3020835 RepID=UPI003511700F